MYDTAILNRRMLELGLNYYRLALKAKVDPKTAKRIVTEGTGYVDSMTAVLKALGLTFPEIMKDRNAHLGSVEKAVPRNGKRRSA